MNGKEQAIAQIEDFLKSDEKCMLLIGTHQYKKHKLIMSVLNNHLVKKSILFRTNSMQNITNDEFLGWAGLKKQPRAGEKVGIGKNIYEFDSLNTSPTWHNSSRDFCCAICYPIDSLCRSRKLETLDDLFKHKNIQKIFLVSWTDSPEYDYSMFSQYFSRHVIYDAEEEEPEYHKRVIEIVKENFKRR